MERVGATWRRRSCEARKARPPGTKHTAAVVSAAERPSPGSRITDCLLSKGNEGVVAPPRLPGRRRPERERRGGSGAREEDAERHVDNFGKITREPANVRWTPRRSVIKRTISDALTAAAGAIGPIRLLSHVLKTNMAPKATRNPGDKNEGVKTTRVGRDKGEPAGVNKHLTSIAGKAVGKNMPGLGKDANMSDSTTPAGNHGQRQK
ncbi:hypothetical protein NDU88_002939 [Pleurodeles waltl]|uniref:Uncharacterized protein n=1 Tax=Pleurodeles waltl TaxID=8319 RepID=A0AAV7T530_PLEWA|nr:hypothetical protein NDU88_002939 [Pleurodeles waltl]